MMGAKPDLLVAEAAAPGAGFGAQDARRATGAAGAAAGRGRLRIASSSRCPAPRTQMSRGGVRPSAGIGSGMGGGSDDVLAFAVPDLLDPKGGEGVTLFAPKTHARVLILYQTTGGGHKASAQALKDAFERRHHRKFEVEILDVLPLCAPPFNRSDKAYDFMVKHPFLWRGAFAWSSTAWGEKLGFAWYKIGFVNNLKRLFRRERPDLVVSVHPLMQVPVLAALKALRREAASDPTRGLPARVPFATVVTDYTTCHATWFDRGVDLCFVPTEETREFGSRRGLAPHQLILRGLPIRPAFRKHQASKVKLRQRLNLSRGLDTVLVVGGGDGMGPVEATCEALDRAMGTRCQLVVICGRNRKLAAKLNKASRGWACKTAVLGFVSNMHEWMTACDCIVTKAGPGTIAESLVCGLPIMLNNFIPCQEAGNVSWVIENGVGDYSSDPEVVATKVAEWFGQRHVLQRMSRKALALSKPEATFRIVEDLVGLVKPQPCHAAPKQRLMPA